MMYSYKYQVKVLHFVPGCRCTPAAATTVWTLSFLSINVQTFKLLQPLLKVKVLLIKGEVDKSREI